MIRAAAAEDAGRLAEIDVLSSRYAYKDILSRECLYDDLTVPNRIPVWQKWIAERRFEIFVYEDPCAGSIRAMMGMGPCEDEDQEGAFELHLLYVDPDDLRQGIGSDMLRFFERKGTERGCRRFVIWVLEENAIGKAFYEKHGYLADGKDKLFRRWNKREIRYLKSTDENAAPVNGL